MAQELKAENLTISIPNTGCNKHCPYCVSKMTGYKDYNILLMERNIEKVRTLANSAEITSVLFTGKGEPTYNDSYQMLIRLSSYFSKFPLELQTNGITLCNNGDSNTIIHDLYLRGFNTIAISIDSEEQMNQLKLYDVFARINAYGMINRITINVTNNFKMAFNDIISYCKTFDIKQMTLRQISIPENAKDKKVENWIKENVSDIHYQKLVNDAKLIINDKKPIRQLNFGVNIYDIDGIAFSHSEYCIQERNNGNNIRSLIFQEDGHLYTSWNSQASILF